MENTEDVYDNYYQKQEGCLAPICCFTAHALAHLEHRKNDGKMDKIGKPFEGIFLISDFELILKCKFGSGWYTVIAM